MRRTIATAALLVLALIAGAAQAGATVVPDATYGGDGTGAFAVDCSGGQIAQVVAGANGRVFALEYCSGTYRRVIALDASGKRDAAFGTNGVSTFQVPSAFARDIFNSEAGSRLVPTASGGVYLAFFYSWFKDFQDPEAEDYMVLEVAALRIGANGLRDTAFGTSGVGRYQRNDATNLDFLRIDAQGRLVLAAVSEGINYTFLARFTTTGRLDSTFSSDGRLAFTLNRSFNLTSLATCANSKIVMAASVQYPSAPNWVADGTMFVRLTSTGALDRTFSGDGLKLVKNSDVNGEVQPGGMVADSSCRVTFLTERRPPSSGNLSALDLERINPDGTRNLTFASNSAAITRASGQFLFRDGLALVRGYPVVGWSLGNTLSTVTPRITGYNNDGTRWTSVGPTGTAPVRLSTTDRSLPYVYSVDWGPTPIEITRAVIN